MLGLTKLAATKAQTYFTVPCAGKPAAVVVNATLTGDGNNRGNGLWEHLATAKIGALSGA